MKISINKQHIDEAVRRDSHHCMIADALKEAIPEAQYILVDVQSIRYSKKNEQKRYCHLTPLTAQRALVKWDRGKPVKPFSFQLPPVHSEREMGWAGQGRQQKNRKGRPKYKNSGKKRLIVAYRERQFGLRNIPE